jgi:hypothetical protein
MVKLRRPTTIEMAIQGILALLVLLTACDLVDAMGATACSDAEGPAMAGCYPWGVSEGPMVCCARKYADKGTYLRTGVVELLALAVAVVIPPFTPGKWIGIAAAPGALVIGFTLADEFVASP